jgi:hypothetical protein
VAGDTVAPRAAPSCEASGAGSCDAPPRERPRLASHALRRPRAIPRSPRTCSHSAISTYMYTGSGLVSSSRRSRRRDSASSSARNSSISEKRARNCSDPVPFSRARSSARVAEMIRPRPGTRMSKRCCRSRKESVRRVAIRPLVRIHASHLSALGGCQLPNAGRPRQGGRRSGEFGCE